MTDGERFFFSSLFFLYIIGLDSPAVENLFIYLFFAHVYENLARDTMTMKIKGRERIGRD